MQDSDKTVFIGINESNSKVGLPPAIHPVSGLGKVPNRTTNYVAQQTSLVDYTPGLNPLVNAAARLLLEIVRLRENEITADREGGVNRAAKSGVQTHDVEVLRDRLEAEIRGFEAQALAADVESSQVLAARYVLCTAVDEAIGRSKIGDSGEWSRLALLSTFHNETWGGEKFFNMLERCMQQPARNLYLLELMYLLLSLGFEGKYHVLDRGPIALESLRDKLYRQIRLLRGEPNPDLAKKVDNTLMLKDKIYIHMPTWALVLIVSFCIGVTFLGFSSILSNRAEPVIQELSTYTTTAGERVGQ